MLELAIARALYERFPDSPEGELTRIRASVVSRASCAVVGRHLELGSRLAEVGRRLAPGEGAQRLVATGSVLAAVLEAGLGALYLEHGFESVRAPIVQAFDERIEYALTTHVDYKTQLQEELARRGKQVVYTVLDTAGPPHERRFTCAAVIDDEVGGTGVGPSKKVGEQAAAKQALERLAPSG